MGMEKKSWFFVGALIILIMFSGIVLLLIVMNYKGDEKHKTDFDVMEFPALSLCRETSGSWERVNSNDYPVDPKKGVYNPTTNPDINYKCFCPAEKKWDIGGGCI